MTRDKNYGVQSEGLESLDIESLLQTLSYVFIKNHAPVSMYESKTTLNEEEKEEENENSRNAKIVENREVNS